SHEVFCRALAFDDFLSRARGLFFELQVFDDMLRSLRHNPASIIEALAPGSPSDLVKVARAQKGGFLSIEFAQACEQHRSDWNIDPDAKSVGAGNDFEQTPLGQLLDQDAILGQEAGVMQANPMPQPFFDFGAVGTSEFETF